MPLRNLLMPAALVALGLAAGVNDVAAQGGFAPQGGEYAIAGELLGDQVNASVAMGADGGYLVWEDNRTDGSGAGVGALRLVAGGTASYEPFRVNSITSGNQERPQVVRLSGGSHLFLWQGGALSQQSIYGRVVGVDGTFVNAADVKINGNSGGGKTDVTAAGLTGGGAIVAWTSYSQDDVGNAVRQRRLLPGVYAQLVDASLGKVGSEFRLNQTIQFGQRSPSLAALASGGFVAVWVNERLSGVGETEQIDGVDIVGRLFSGTGQALGNEFVINGSANICAHPRVVGSGSGFTVVWSERDGADRDSSWNVNIRHFTSASPVSGLAINRLNSHAYGDQYRPMIAQSGGEQLVVWSSMGQDGSLEGVYGRFVSQGSLVGDEFRVNTTTISKQFLPVVASTGEAAFTVIWSGFVGGNGSVDLMAQRYAVELPKPAAPVVSALSSYELLVAWPQMAGFEVSAYELYVNGSSTPLDSVEVFKKVSGLNPGTSHTFRLAYRLADGRTSPLSDLSVGKTWGADLNFDGLPDDWQAAYFGTDDTQWPSVFVDSDNDGVDNRTEFFAGTIPSSAASVLRMSIGQTEQGWQISWNSTPGLVYRLQTSADFTVWDNVGGYRFAAGSVDSTFLNESPSMSYYRLIRIR